MERTGHIYKITCKVNGNVYIGQTIQNVEERWKQHKYNARNKKKGKIVKTAICSAMRTYGVESFTFEHILDCPKSELDYHEAKLIRDYDCLIPKGYNMLRGKKLDNFQELFEEPKGKEEIIAPISSKTAPDNTFAIVEKYMKELLMHYHAKMVIDVKNEYLAKFEGLPHNGPVRQYIDLWENLVNRAFEQVQTIYAKEGPGN